ncbi:hypothetical protein DAEQUDRAFT_713475 [Daedalea quercina L-15889]|uniref:Arrestin-like N-terminal domain-containing protein n=1 Tax=Daedalea quercina L-15889 TaxID=1314783 RepID=A0A165NW97_9APHY|nr:hypothetical protein DAEQUDRAFT_713475 [Daedalea quercina L-15889]
MDASSHPESEPPEYGNVGNKRSELVQHTEQLENGKGNVWLRLAVESRAKSPKQRPLFVTADTIRGSVEIDCEHIGQPKGISIAVTASMTAVGQEEERFLHISQSLWSNKDPSKGKLPAGRSSWPFAIVLPEKIAPAGKSKASSPAPYPLPPSFSEKGSPAYIDYKLITTVRRGLFKSNQTLVCPFVYLSVSQAEPPSRLRLAAYRDGTALSGPDGDPEGWQISPSANITGTLFDARQVEVRYTLAVARPLTHSRGSPIPLSVTVISEDEQALSLLSAPASIRLCLIRFRVLGPNAMFEDTEAARSDQIFQETVGTAYFWPSDASMSGGSSRTLWGELLVKSDSKPSFVCPGFSLGYTVSLFPAQAAGFVPKVQSNEPLATQKISVTTTGPAGVSIRSHAPPGYEYPEEADYTNTLGYLENGNQRFLHHGVGGTFAIG